MIVEMWGFRMLLDIPFSSWGWAGGILLVALFLGLWQYFDQKSRVPDLFPEDREFFGRQDGQNYRSKYGSGNNNRGQQ